MTRLLQFTDLHLLADKEAFFCNINPYQQLKSLVEKGKAYCPDGVLLTGDLSQDMTEQSYQHIIDTFKTMDCPHYFIPGNHDNVDLCRSVLLKAGFYHEKQLDLGPWQVVFLDSVMPGEIAGHLKQLEFDFLKKAIVNGKRTMVCMHHHPLPVSEFMDRYMINNHAAFVSFIKPIKNIQMILFGHIHSEFHQRIDHIDFYATPSTSVQFSITASSKEDGFDSKAPGFRVIELEDDGFTTEVLRLF